ncbi:macro domain-containing protein [Amycolatopsis sp. TNS106]|uniref:macro domain-containing protein n=1 Tax=Amycolatopsis sp. TNS106 TaxID=2861750 RepID=UPI001C561D40|nr:macro domain-containing protein [Amycolatopsis sp. TNS106]QXV57394.1 Appr-1-p processing protein [Amycolatopsis sp. TNS106]
MTLQYVTGDATQPVTTGSRVIAHVCNDRGGWGKGFVVALSRRWPELEDAYRAWARRSDFCLGAVDLVRVESETWIANMVAQHGYRSASNPVPLRYDALEKALSTVAKRAGDLGASVHLPRIGCGLAGGTWEHIAPLIERTLTIQGIPTTVYDLP